MTASISADVDRAVEVLGNGGLVAIPTETVYGLAADATAAAAVRRIFAVKGRPPTHPLIVHLHDADQAASWATGLTGAARRLAAACWPGPLTIVVRRAAGVLDEVTGGRPTVGLRVPAHPLAAAVCRGVGRGLAAPSANRFGRVSPTTAAHVAADLGDAVDLILDGGPCEHGVESTIVDCTVTPPQILRAGAISPEDLDALLDDADLGLGLDLTAPAGPSRAPGMLAAHYAPRTPLFVVDDGAQAQSLAESLGVTRIIGTPDDLVRYARHLYAWLRDADGAGLDAIIAIQPEARGLGHALRDRLTKAAYGSRREHPTTS